MRLRFTALLGAVLLAAPAQGQPQPPKLVVAISIDQLSTDLFTQYRPHFNGGLKRLADGVAFANGYQAHGSSETCPGHSTILTGSHPARTGIVANVWIDFDAPRADKQVYCAEDETVSGTSSQAYQVSAAHLRLPALGDWLKRTDPEAQVVAVAKKDRAAVMLGGQAPDQRWWWKGGRFVQNSAAAPVPIAAQVNEAIARTIAQPRPGLAPPAFCEDRAEEVQIGPSLRVGSGRFARAAGDADAFASGPEMDAATLALAAALAQQLDLGRGPGTDLLAIGLSATDYVGHAYGSGGLEMCLQLMSLDSDLRGFFGLLDRLGIDYVAVLTADHGVLDIPERRPGSGSRVDPEITAGALGAEISRQMGLDVPAFVGDWYIAEAIPEARRTAVLDVAKRMLGGHPQVHSLHTAAEVSAHPLPGRNPSKWSVLDRLRASFDPARSPDLFVVYQPGVMPIPEPEQGYTATHGSVWDYDRKVPILFWSPTLIRQDRTESAMTVDILPTLASLIGLELPEGAIDGECLDLVPGEGSNCP